MKFLANTCAFVEWVLVRVSALAFLGGILGLALPWLANERSPGPVIAFFGGVYLLVMAAILFVAAKLLTWLRKRP